MIKALEEENLVRTRYPTADCPFQVNDLTELETYLLQISVVDFGEGVCSSYGALVKMVQDGGW